MRPDQPVGRIATDNRSPECNNNDYRCLVVLTANATSRGYATHGDGTNDHDDHPDTGGDYPGGQPSTIWGWQSDPDPLDHTETDNEPPHWIGPGIIKY